MSTKVTEELVREALAKVQDPELNNDLVALNMVKDIVINNGTVEANIELTTIACPLKSKIETDCVTEIRLLEGVQKVKINFSARAPKETEIKVPNIKKIIAISSGKGGVGKSTAAVNIAMAFSDAGYSVGLIDADIYGPNIPLLLDNDQEPEVAIGDRIIPVEHKGLKFISMAQFLAEGQAVIWRGPLLHGAVKQFFTEVEWGNLDYLFVDLPPGTGDVHISLCQLVEITGAIVVTTPQKLSVSDVKKGIAMFRQMQVDILGIIENMSFYFHPSSSEKIYVFGKDGGVNLANEWNIPLLAQIPIDPIICERSESAITYFRAVVDKVNAEIDKQKPQK